jgi:hypothetical protein
MRHRSSVECGSRYGIDGYDMHSTAMICTQRRSSRHGESLSYVGEEAKSQHSNGPNGCTFDLSGFSHAQYKMTVILLDNVGNHIR